jgi:hypothetical protein
VFELDMIAFLGDFVPPICLELSYEFAAVHSVIIHTDTHSRKQLNQLFIE